VEEKTCADTQKKSGKKRTGRKRKKKSGESRDVKENKQFS